MESETQELDLLERKTDLLLRTGKLLIQSLADSNRIDRNMRRIADYMGIPVDKFHMHITYTTLMITVGDGNHSVTKFQKCLTHSVNMTVLSEISMLSWRALEKKYSLDEYEKAVNKIENAKQNYSGWLTIVGVGLACAGFGKLFGCDWPAALITMIASSAAVFVRRKMHKNQFNMYMTVAISAFIAVAIACAGALLHISQTPHHPVFACVLFLIPGVPLINCIDDMIDGFTIVGVTRAVIAFGVIGAIAFGMAFALKAFGVENDYSVTLVSHEEWYVIAGSAAVAAIGFAVLFNVPLHTLLISALGGAITVVLRNFLVYEIGWSLPLGSFCGAFVFGVITLYVVRVVHVPGHVITIPSVIPMVPGVLMYNAIIGILNFNAFDGLHQLPLLAQIAESGIKAGMTLLAISLGVAIPNVIGRRYFPTDPKRLSVSLNRQ